jgi:hypothetical protein
MSNELDGDFMATIKKPDVPETLGAPKNGYEKSKQLVEQLGNDSILSPLMKIINELIEDPMLKKTLESAPASYNDNSKLN